MKTTTMMLMKMYGSILEGELTIIQQFRDQKDAILFLIRVSDSMVHITDEGTSALKTTLQCAYELLLQKIISNPKDMVGIVLYGTVLPTSDHSSNPA